MTSPRKLPASHACWVCGAPPVYATEWVFGWTFVCDEHADMAEASWQA